MTGEVPAPLPAERTVAFVDLAGFTALNETHGDDPAVDLVHHFYDLAADAVRNTTGEVVKPIGDAVMMAFHTPGDAVAATGSLFGAAHERDRFPLLRAGLHHGPTVQRDDDYFGTTVNTAARVAAHARGDQILATEVVAQAARAAGHDIVNLGHSCVAGLVDPVEMWELRLTATADQPTVDPVCRMRVDRDAAAGRIRHNGQDHWFCSLSCIARFTTAPDRYALGAGEEAPPGS